MLRSFLNKKNIAKLRKILNGGSRREACFNGTCLNEVAGNQKTTRWDEVENKQRNTLEGRGDWQRKKRGQLLRYRLRPAPSSQSGTHTASMNA